jgi:hypothetical protein
MVCWIRSSFLCGPFFSCLLTVLYRNWGEGDCSVLRKFHALLIFWICAQQGGKSKSQTSVVVDLVLKNDPSQITILSCFIFSKRFFQNFSIFEWPHKQRNFLMNNNVELQWLYSAKFGQMSYSSQGRLRKRW